MAEPSAKSVVRFTDLRGAFKDKFNAADIINKLKLPTIYILDDPKTGAFLKSLRKMRDEEGLSTDDLLAMMDAFVAMVLSREISIEGKPVWRTFVAKRLVLLERARRMRAFGSGEGFKPDEGMGAEALDRMRRRRLDRRSPSE